MKQVQKNIPKALFLLFVLLAGSSASGMKRKRSYEELDRVKKRRKLKKEENLEKKEKTLLEVLAGPPPIEDSLHFCDNFHYEIVKEIIAIGGDINSVSNVVSFEDDDKEIHYEEFFNAYERAFLHDAVISGRLDIVLLLLSSDHGVNIMAKDEYGKAPFHYAHMLYCNALKLNKPNNDEKELRKKILVYLGFFNTLMFCLKGNLIVGDNSKKAGAELTDEYFVRKFEEILKKKIGLHVRDANMCTLLHHACLHGRLYIVKKLLDYGMKVDLRDEKNRTPLHYAVYNEHHLVIRELLARGANVDSKDYRCRTPLHRAAAKDLACAKVLVDGGADINALDSDKSTPLHYAVSSGAYYVVSLLNSHKDIQPTIRNRFGKTPLCYAKQKDD